VGPQTVTLFTHIAYDMLSQAVGMRQIDILACMIGCKIFLSNVIYPITARDGQKLTDDTRLNFFERCSSRVRPRPFFS
jgi:hypothetical protein